MNVLNTTLNAKGSIVNERTFGAYIHIPFCNYKCHFCDFVTAPNNLQQQNDYCNILGKEIKERIALMAVKPRVTSIFYGGGTPGILESEYFKKVHHTLLENVNLDVDAEITLETTPETVTFNKAKLWRDLGVNRLSIGIESFDDEELALLGRKHTVAQAIDAIAAATQAGFENINCDLMYGLPVQDFSGWQRSLNKFLQIAAEFSQVKHLSAYALELSPQTPLAKKFPLLNTEEASENKYIAQHKYLLDTLPSGDFQQYEISNFSKIGFPSKHNLNYWLGGSYLAFGVSASRYVNCYRGSNWRSLRQYMSDYMGEEVSELIDADKQLKEAIMLGLRMISGINLHHFQQTFHVDLQTKYSNPIARLSQTGMIEIIEQRLKLTDKGQTLANLIIAEFF